MIVRYIIYANKFKNFNLSDLYFDNRKFSIRTPYFRYHSCNKCSIPCIKSPEDVRKDEEKLEYLKSKGTLITITSCEWYQIIQSLCNVYSDLISPFLWMKSISESMIIDAVKNNLFYGFLVININSTEALKTKYKQWPPIFVKKDVTPDMLPTWMKAEGRKNVPLQAFDGEKILVHSLLMQWYIEQG